MKNHYDLSNARPAQPGQRCIFCNTADFVFSFRDRPLCKNCVAAMNELLEAPCLTTYLSEPVDALGHGVKDCRFIWEDGPFFNLCLVPLDIQDAALEKECWEVFGDYEIQSFQAAQKFLADHGFLNLAFRLESPTAAKEAGNE